MNSPGRSKNIKIALPDKKPSIIIDKKEPVNKAKNTVMDVDLSTFTDTQPSISAFGPTQNTVFAPKGDNLSQIIDNESIMETTMKTLNQSNMMNESSINV